MIVAAPGTPGACSNCGAPFVPERRRFCPECGQETDVAPPRLREFLQQFGGAYLSTEGALWRTLKLLLFKPGELTARYLAGQRKHHVLPLRLYLTISLLALLIVRLAGTTVAVGGLDDPQLQVAAQAAKPTVMLNLYVARAGLRDGVYQCVRLPDWLCQRLRPRIEARPVAFLTEMRGINSSLQANLGALMFLLLPVFAFGLWLVYRNRRLPYSAHLVYALHLHAFWFIVLAILQVDLLPVTVLGVLVMAVYAALSGRRVYGGRWWPRLLRVSVLVVYYGIALMAVVPLVVLTALLV